MPVQFIVMFNHRHLREYAYFGLFSSHETAKTWADKKVDDCWTFYEIKPVCDPKADDTTS